MSEDRDPWDKADVISKWLIPIVIALATFWFNYAANERQASETRAISERQTKERKFEVALGILQAPISPQTKSLRPWATGIFRDETGLSPEATSELEFVPLPTTLQLQFPDSYAFLLSASREAPPQTQNESDRL